MENKFEMPFYWQCEGQQVKLIYNVSIYVSLVLLRPETVLGKNIDKKIVVMGFRICKQAV